MSRRLSYWLLAAWFVLLLALVVAWQLRQTGIFSSALPTALLLEAGDQEIAFLQPATNAADWERFLEAALYIKNSKQLEIDTSRAFPDSTAAVPEIAWRVQRSRSWIRVRWYKLTSSTDVNYWISQLARRGRLPLAVIGGDSSNRASAIAESLLAHFGGSSASPRLLITTATADKVAQQDLMGIYQQRTFRFCFTNRQMATAIADFLWQRPELDLLPDSGPVYLVAWEDNFYSLDLVIRFRETLPHLALAPVTDTNANREPYWYQTISHSIGGFGRPSAEETAAAEALLNELERRPGQQRGLLVLPANSWPARRFLRALARASPTAARRVIVLNGDAIDFNTIYRDGLLTWPIQDLPFQLVFFCHRNPIDRTAGFRSSLHSDIVVQDLTATTAADTGTYDLLLYADIVSAITEAGYRGAELLADAEEFDKGLRAGRFDVKGNRLDRSGEHVVCVRPERNGDRVLPQAQVRVYGRTATGWERRNPELRLIYGASRDQGSAEGGGS